MDFFGIIKHILRSITAVIALIPLVLTMWMDDAAYRDIIPNEEATNPYIREYLETDISAHRAGAGVAPQNTLMAFEKILLEAEEIGVDTMEFDVQLTADGELILLHNLTYDETTNAVEEFGHKDVYASDLTFEEAQVLNLGENFTPDGENYPYRGLRGEDIPYNLRVAKCEDIIDYIEKNSNGKKYNYIIEIKSRNEIGEAAADELYRIITERNMWDRVIWATSKPEVAEYLRTEYPDTPRSASTAEVFLFYLYARMDWDLEDLNVQYCALQIPGESDIVINLGSRKIINYAHKYDLAVQFWTINTERDARHLIANGADCIMTDYPEMVQKIQDELKAENN